MKKRNMTLGKAVELNRINIIGFFIHDVFRIDSSGMIRKCAKQISDKYFEDAEEPDIDLNQEVNMTERDLYHIGQAYYMQKGLDLAFDINFLTLALSVVSRNKEIA